MIAVLLVMFFLCAPTAIAADYTITAATPSYFDMSNVGLEPGDTIWLAAGTRERLQLLNIRAGTAEKPITITNLGGQFVISNTDQKAIEIQNSKHFIIKGTPGPGYEYGIKIARNGRGPGISLINGTTDFEICNVEICNTSFAGIEAKSDGLDRSVFVMENIKIHDCYIHDTGGEGMYLGSSFFDDVTAVPQPHEVHNIEVYNNLIVNAGWDGFQLGSATEGVSVHDNIILGCGLLTDWNYQKDGMRLNPGTCGRFYNNWIDGGPMSTSGINANPYDDTYIFNNVIISPPNHGIYIGDDKVTLPGTSVYLMNNTIVSPATEGIEFRTRLATGSLACNNIICNPGVDYFRRFYPEVKITEFNNLYVSTVAAVGFKDPANGDYTLSATSPAINAGANVYNFGIYDDFDGTVRPQGIAYDIGAFEFVLTGNNAPAVAAGYDLVVTLPHIAVLDGRYADDGLPNPPGAVSLAWSQVSGPGSVTFADTIAEDTTASFPSVGTYVLRLTASDGSLSTYDEITVTVRNNTAPKVDAGEEQTILANQGVNLEATISDDGYPDPPAGVTTVWSKTSGPGSVIFTDANALATTATFSSGGVYVLRLTANDGALSTYDEVTITVNSANMPPAVSAGNDATILYPSWAGLDGTISDDGVPNPPATVTVIWSQVSGPGVASFADETALDTTATFSAIGTYVLRLTADDSELTAYDDVTITVNPSSVTNQTILVPTAWGKVGSLYCAATGSFDCQPIWDPINEVPVGADINPNEDTDTNYAGRYWYIDFGPDYANYRITETWTRYRPYSSGTFIGFGEKWWDDDLDTINDGITEYTLEFQHATFSSISAQRWAQDVDANASPIIPAARYLVIKTGTAPSDRPNEFCLVGYAVSEELQTLDGDYNQDGLVDLADYTLWADHYGQTGPAVPGDGNGDGVVDLADYTVWADHYGESVGPY